MKTNKIILALLGITVAGLLFFSYKNKAIQNSEESLTPQTQVIVYTPKLGNYPQERGECWAGSTALQGRSGSLRCAVDSRVYDPCFNVEGKIICDTSPLESGEEFELIPQEGDKYGVIKDSDLEENTGNKRFSWIYQLEDGFYCRLIQGTAGSLESGEFYYYVCDGNKVIIEDVDKLDDLWQAEIGHLSNDNREFVEKRETQSVVKAWE